MVFAQCRNGWKVSHCPETKSSDGLIIFNLLLLSFCLLPALENSSEIENK